MSLGDLQTVYHAIKVLGIPPEHVPDKNEISFSEEESVLAAISQSFNGSKPLRLAEVAVKGPVFSTNFLAIGFAKIRIAILFPPNRLSRGSMAGRITVRDPSGNADKKSSKSVVKWTNSDA